MCGRSSGSSVTLKVSFVSWKDQTEVLFGKTDASTAPSVIT